MPRVIDRMKLAWHLDLVAEPVTHGWILNLYRAGEQHPQTVDDYFPAEHAPWPELASDLRRHAADERKHTALYTRAIEAMGQPVLELDADNVFNAVIRAHTPLRWAITPSDDAEACRRKLAHFMAHAHHLELKVARSLEYHAEACARRERAAVADVVARVLADEERHVRYTREAVDALTMVGERPALLALHARAVDAADREFSARQVHNWHRRAGHTVPRRRRALYLAAAWVMAGSRD